MQLHSGGVRPRVQSPGSFCFVKPAAWVHTGRLGVLLDESSSSKQVRRWDEMATMKEIHKLSPGRDMELGAVGEEVLKLSDFWVGETGEVADLQVTLLTSRMICF